MHQICYNIGIYKNLRRENPRFIANKNKTFYRERIALIFSKRDCFIIMTIEENNWEPLQPEEVSELFKSLDIKWWIAGGWAIDLFLGKKSRDHLDIDVLIFRKDQMIIHKHLKGWELYKTNQPGLKP